MYLKGDRVKAYRLNNGSLLVPKVATDGEVLGDGMVEVAPGSQEFEDWKDEAVDIPDEFRQ